MTRLRSRLTYANVVSTLCLFLLVAGGGAFAASKLARNSVGPKQIKNGAVGSTKLADSSVTTSKLADSAVSSAKLGNASVIGSKIGGGAVTLDKLGSDVTGDTALGSSGSGFAGGICNPADLTGTICGQTTVNLTQPGEVLVIADGVNDGDATGVGACQLFEGTTSNGLGPGVGSIPQGRPFSMSAVTDVLSAGSHTIGMFCTQATSDAIFDQMHFAVITLSAN